MNKLLSRHVLEKKKSGMISPTYQYHRCNTIEKYFLKAYATDTFVESLCRLFIVHAITSCRHYRALSNNFYIHHVEKWLKELPTF